MDTRSILDHQYEAFGAGNADEIVEDFAEDAVLIRADTVFEGRPRIHAAYSEMFAGRFKPGTYEFTLDAEHVIGDIAYIAWRASCLTDEVTLGADTFVVRDGKIVAQTYTATVDLTQGTNKHVPPPEIEWPIPKNGNQPIRSRPLPVLVASRRLPKEHMI